VKKLLRRIYPVLLWIVAIVVLSTLAAVALHLNTSSRPLYEAILNKVTLPADFYLIDSTFEEGGPLAAPHLIRRYRVHSSRASVLAELKPALQNQGYELRGSDVSDYHVAIRGGKNPGVLTIRLYPMDPHAQTVNGSVLYPADMKYPDEVNEVSIDLSP
jgi:hypothetical protein